MEQRIHIFLRVIQDKIRILGQMVIFQSHHISFKPFIIARRKTDIPGEPDVPMTQFNQMLNGIISPEAIIRQNAIRLNSRMMMINKHGRNTGLYDGIDIFRTEM